ncbi:MAG: hypothetical protein WC523_07615 [Patescibacteria group bacterium]
MTDQPKVRVALIIRKIKSDPDYLTKNFFYQNALNTFRVLNKIQAIDRRLITGGLLAGVTKYLISLEIKPGGPYSEDKASPDYKLNAEIAIFLNNQGVKLPALEPYLDKVPPHQANHKVFEHIRHLAEKSLNSLPPSFQTIMKPKIEAVIKSDRDQQILLLAYFFKLALGHSGARIASETIYELGVANLFLWLAYTIYDNIIDGDESPDSLPLANFAAREFVTRLNRQKTSREYQFFFKKIMAKMDYSQIWERKYGRFNHHKDFILSAPIRNYQKPAALYAKSLAHCLGPMLILDQLKCPPESESGKNVLSFFKYYLSVRQLQDDIYDLEIDYQKGIITSANIRLIKNKISRDQLTDYFLQKELPRLQAKIINYQQTAERHLNAATVIRYPDYLKQFLSPLKIDPAEIRDFLNAYRNQT